MGLKSPCAKESMMQIPAVPSWSRENHPARFNMLSYFRGENFRAQYVPNLSQIAFPQFTRTVVAEIASSKAVGFDLVLLCFLSSIAAAERGKHRVVLSDGSKNSLSIIVHVGAESGAGKGRALEESLAFFTQWEKIAVQKIKEENKARADENELALVRIATLTRQYSKEFNPEIAEQICAEKRNLKETLPVPCLLLNDVTASAYTQELVNHGVAVRLESDGILLPADTLRIVNKAWSGESSRRTRLTMPEGTVHDPFIVDLVLTQPESFLRHISDPDTIASGRLARTLVYLHDNKSFVPQQPTHELNPETRKQFYTKLADLLHYSEQETQAKTEIFVEREAEDLFFKTNAMWHDQCQFGGSLYKIRDFGERMGQHALRLAGILHLAEHQIGSSTEISSETMQIAINMTEVFADHTFAYRIKDYGDFNRECCRAIMTFILEKNFYDVPELIIKQALKHRYKAADINVGLHHLQQCGYLLEQQNPFHQNHVGRPLGRTFINPYHDRNGQVM